MLELWSHIREPLGIQESVDRDCFYSFLCVHIKIITHENSLQASFKWINYPYLQNQFVLGSQ